MDGDDNPRYEVSQIRPNLFICGYTAHSRHNFERHGITHAVDVSNSGVIHFPDKEYIAIPIRDREEEDIAQYFETITEWIKCAMQQGGKVLVFCRVGVSRSATICIMYLVIHEQLDLRSAYNTVKNARSIIHPNRGFRAQMIAYTKQKSGRLLEDEDAYVFRRSRTRSPYRYRDAKRARRAPPVDPEKMNKVLELVFMAYKQISLQPNAGAATQRSVEQN